MTEHLITLAAIALVAAGCIFTARIRPRLWTEFLVRGLAALLIGAELAWWTYLFVTRGGADGFVTAFPLQLCDMAIFVAAFALLFRTQLLVELTYFWAIAGTLQALLTPDLPYHFPNFVFIQYYVAHGGVVVAALVLVVGLAQWPRPNAFLRVATITLGYATFVAIVDALTGANYMYLRAKPPSPTLLDLFGPWPWYVAWATVLGIALFLILEAPFRVLRGRPGHEKGSGAETQI